MRGALICARRFYGPNGCHPYPLCWIVVAMVSDEDYAQLWHSTGVDRLGPVTYIEKERLGSLIPYPEVSDRERFSHDVEG